jgi:hypothetical protein
MVRANIMVCKNIEEMLSKIHHRTKISGLEGKTEEQIKQFYEEITRYLLHIIEAYKIGQAGGDLDEKKVILQRLADMQIYCFPRWKQEIKQMYDLRPQQVKESNLTLTLEDRLLERLRKKRIEIITTSLLKFGLGNVHEPNFLLDLLGDTLGLRLERMNDPFTANFARFHPFEESVIRFTQFYKPSEIIYDLIAHMHLQQIQKKSDPLDLSPGEIYEWLRERVAVEWKKEEYESLPQKIQKMQEEGVPITQISTLLKQYGIDWNLEEAPLSPIKEELSKDHLRMQRRVNQLKQQQLTINVLKMKKISQVSNELNAIHNFMESNAILIPEEIKNDREKLIAKCKVELLKEVYEFMEMNSIMIPQNIMNSRKKLLQHCAIIIQDKLDQAQAHVGELKKMMDAKGSDNYHEESLHQTKRLRSVPSLNEVLTPKVLKEAQIQTFFKTEIFGTDQKFITSAAMHLLVSVGAMTTF